MVQLETQQGEQLFGVVRYIGDAPGQGGRWAGVEMEDEVRGGNNGWIQVSHPSYYPSAPAVIFQSVARPCLSCGSSKVSIVVFC